MQSSRNCWELTADRAPAPAMGTKNLFKAAQCCSRTTPVSHVLDRPVYTCRAHSDWASFALRVIRRSASILPPVRNDRDCCPWHRSLCELLEEPGCISWRSARKFTRDDMRFRKILQLCPLLREGNKMRILYTSRKPAAPRSRIFQIFGVVLGP